MILLADDSSVLVQSIQSGGVYAAGAVGAVALIWFLVRVCLLPILKAVEPIVFALRDAATSNVECARSNVEAAKVNHSTAETHKGIGEVQLEAARELKAGLLELKDAKSLRNAS